MVQLLRFDCDEIEWDCTRHWMVCQIIRNAGTLATGTFMELETCVRNRVRIDMCVFDASKVDKWQRNQVHMVCLTFKSDLSGP